MKSLAIPTLLLGFLSLTACRQEAKNYADIGYPDRTERTANNVFEDIQAGNYDKSVDVKEVIAHDACDCLSNVNWELVMLTVDSIEVATAKGESAQLKGYDSAREIGLLQSCVLILSPRAASAYEGCEGTEEEIKAIQGIFKRKCPDIYHAIDREVIRGWFKKDLY